MNILHRVTWKTMWSNRTRTLVTLLGIALSAAMFCAVTTLVGSVWDYLYRVEVQSSGDYYLSGDYLSESQVEAVTQDERVASVAHRKVLGYYNMTPEDYGPGMNTCVIAAGDDALFRDVPVKLVEGRLPQTSDEILISAYTQSVLEYNRLPSTVGSTVTLPVLSYPPDGEPTDEPALALSYTIVGVGDDMLLYEDRYFSVSYTYDDGRQGEALYEDVYVKTRSPYQALETAEALDLEPNNEILAFFAVTDYTMIDLPTLLVLVGVVLGIILLATVLLIRNAFSISVTQRTRDFGLLASLGATRKQVRASVRFEALLLCALGIPAGILLGLGGVALALEFVGQRLTSMFGVVQADVALYLVPHPLTILAAVLITLLAVLLSAHTSARRAAATSPIAAIRQTGSDRIREKNVRASRGAWKRLGAPGALAWKYYRVNRRRHRATVLALGFSVILLFSSFAASGLMEGIADIPVDNFDFSCFGDKALLEQIRSHESVSKSVLIRSEHYQDTFAMQDYDPEYIAALKKTRFSEPLPDDWQPDEPFHVYYVEDEPFRTFLKEQGLDAEAYFARENPAVLFYKPTLRKSEIIDGDLVIHRYTVRPILPDSPIYAYPHSSLTPLREAAKENISFEDYRTDHTLSRTDENELLVTYSFSEYILNGSGIAESTGKTVTFTYLGKPEGLEDGGGYRFYDYDPETKETGTTVIARIDTKPFLTGCRAGASVDAIPFGVDRTLYIMGIVAFMPLSKYPGGADSAYLCIKTADYEATKAFLDGITDAGFSYSDRVAPQQQQRNILFLIQVCCFGFVALISLICAANIFNTVSTIISMRRREFGMLRSLGMKWRELCKMVTLEWLRFGAYTLLWSLPVGYLISFLLKGDSGFRFPWKATLFAVGGTAVLIFIGVVYALKKVKADTPMEAIRLDVI